MLKTRLLIDTLLETKDRLTDQALALYLRHKIKPYKDQVSLLAGSEDLRALLPKLTLDKAGNEVFILIRPYIHAMILQRTAKIQINGIIYLSINIIALMYMRF